MLKVYSAAPGWVTLLTVVVFVSSCPGRSPLPEDPGVLNEDFGLGIHLGMLAEEASSKAVTAAACHIEVISRDELNQRAPYDSAENPQDRVLVIHQESSEIGDAAGAFNGDIVSEIRCYLADPANSVVQLGGQPAAILTEELAQQIYGQPVQRTATGDNEVHYTYYFELSDEPNQMLELVLSFHNGGYCFAIALALKPRVK